MSAVPNFFLIGAPKCGTTSIASWLGGHPDVFMCTPKEPFFFCRDLVTPRAANNWNDYRRLFADADPSRQAIGEASTTYLRSTVAVPSILERIPDARFIVCLRNPVDMVASVHAQLLRGARETERDLPRAWALQERRRYGADLPPGTSEPRDLLYSDMCSLGTQLKRLYNHVDSARVHILFQEDMREKPVIIWRNLQRFLGLREDGRRAFPKDNARAIPRSAVGAHTLRRLHHGKRRLFPGRHFGLGAYIGRLLERPPRPEEIRVDDNFRQSLVENFASEIDCLEKLTTRDLSHWRQMFSHES